MAYSATSLGAGAACPAEARRLAAHVVPFDPSITPTVEALRDLPTGGWRTFRPAYVTRESPCNLDCPAGTDVRKAVLFLRPLSTPAGRITVSRVGNSWTGADRTCT